jgi:hypothetical protein
MNPSDFENDKDTEAERAIAALESRKNTITSIEGALREQMPDVMRELDDARAEIEGLQEAVKVACRPLGPGTHLIGGHAVQVKNASTTTVVDEPGLVERATEAGDIDELVKLGVLKYAVVPHQIARLPVKQRVRYETYLKQTTGTSSVLLPPELK